MEVVPRTWVAGTPRTWGNKRYGDQWLECMKAALNQFSPHEADRFARYEVTLEFRIWSSSPKYHGQLTIHGPDLDTLVKHTIDVMTRHEGLGIGVIDDDSSIYRISSSKELVNNDDETGAWISVSTI